MSEADVIIRVEVQFNNKKLNKEMYKGYLTIRGSIGFSL